jgi:hypothetical protein
MTTLVILILEYVEDIGSTSFWSGCSFEWRPYILQLQNRWSYDTC